MLNPTRNNDLSDIQTRQQVIRRQIHKDDFCRLGEHLIWYGFANANSYDAGYNVGETFQMLHVERGVDIYARRQQLLDVAPAFGVTASGGVGVSQFIDQDELAARRQRGVHVEVLNDAPLVIDRPKRKLGKPIEKTLCLFPVVRLDNADRNTDTFLKLLPRRQKHRVGLPDPGASAKENLETTAPLLLELLRYDFEQFIGVRSPVLHRIASLCCRSAVLCGHSPDSV